MNDLLIEHRRSQTSCLPSARSRRSSPPVELVNIVRFLSDFSIICISRLLTVTITGTVKW